MTINATFGEFVPQYKDIMERIVRSVYDFRTGEIIEVAPVCEGCMRERRDGIESMTVRHDGNLWHDACWEAWVEHLNRMGDDRPR